MHGAKCAKKFRGTHLRKKSQGEGKKMGLKVKVKGHGSWG